MRIEQALEKLYSMHKFGIKLGLENINELLNHVGNPQKKFKSIHIAGSNGKGSTASFISSILIENGLKVGLYTSPHFVRFNERVRINGIEIPDDYIAEFVGSLEPYIDKKLPTYFEITTALAFKYFEEMSVDIAVIETGLGGRLDATNTINPLLSVITSISKEHTNILGESIEEITYEKAGIIKNNTDVLMGNLTVEAKNVVKEIAAKKSSKYFSISDFIKISENYFTFQYEDFVLNIYELPLKGEYQYYNSALAILIAIRYFNCNTEIILKGLKNVLTNSGIQGRFEFYSKSPDIIFDAAHNLEGVEMFLTEFRKLKNNYDSKTLLFGAMEDKNIPNMLNLLKDEFDNIYGITINYERALKTKSLVRIANELKIDVIPLEQPEEFIENFKTRDKNECLVALGSIYIIGEIKAKIMKVT